MTGGTENTLTTGERQSQTQPLFSLSCQTASPASSEASWVAVMEWNQQTRPELTLTDKNHLAAMDFKNH